MFRSVVRTALFFLLPIVTMVFLVTNRDFGTKAYSWHYAAVIIACGIAITLIPHRDAVVADIVTLGSLLGLQLEFVYLVEWGAMTRTTGAFLLKLGIPLTCFIALVVVVARANMWLIAENERTVFAADRYWAQRIGYSASTAVLVALVSIICALIWLGVSPVRLFGDPALLVIVILVLTGFLILVADWATYRAQWSRWERHGFGNSIPAYQGLPEYIVREILQAERRMEVAHNQSFFFFWFGNTALAAVFDSVLGANSIHLLMVGLAIALVLGFIVGRRVITNHKRSWYEAVKTRVVDAELLRRASRLSSLGWPEKDPEA